MQKKQIQDIITEIAAPIVDAQSFELVDVEFVKEGANWYLRVYIDKPGGITIDDCQIVSEQLSEKLDKLDPIEQSYFLEVSSPGLERPLKKDKDFDKYKGSIIEIKVFQPINGEKNFTGELVGLVRNKIVIKNKSGDVLEFERDKVALAKRAITI